MNDASINDLTINGAGSTGGGHYHAVTINGSGTISGALTCDSFTGNGAVSVQGLLTSGSLTVHGAGDFHGGIHADNVQLHGQGNVQGDTAARQLEVHGAAELRGGLTAEGVNVQGAITITGGCTAEIFTVKGGVTIAGLLNADTVDIEMHGNCRAHEIGGSTIRIIRARHLLAGLYKLLQTFTDHHHGFTVDTVEGDDVILESTRARVVRGKRITIGPDCEVEEVEYTDSCQVDAGATVKEAKQVSHPA